MVMWSCAVGRLVTAVDPQNQVVDLWAAAALGVRDEAQTADAQKRNTGYSTN